MHPAFECTADAKESRGALCRALASQPEYSQSQCPLPVTDCSGIATTQVNQSRTLQGAPDLKQVIAMESEATQRQEERENEVRAAQKNEV